MLVDGKVLDQKGKQNVKQFNYDSLKKQNKKLAIIEKKLIYQKYNRKIIKYNISLNCSKIRINTVKTFGDLKLYFIKIS